MKDDGVEIARKTMVMFFLIDTSGSMEGEKIGALNDAMRDIIPDIRDISEKNAQVLIKIAVLGFASGTEWITPLPQEFDTFKWNNLEAGGCTDLGEACSELNTKLDPNGFIESNIAPVIILMSDGEPTDDYKSKLSVLTKNKWFKIGLKVAIAIGQDANKDILAEFTGNKELVIPVHNKAMLKKMIRVVSVTSSKVGSSKAGSGTGTTEAKEAQVIDQIQEELEDSNPEDAEVMDW